MTDIDRDLLEDALTYAGEWIAYRQRTLHVPGVVVGVAHAGEQLLTRAYGMADLERDIPMTTEHAFRIASHSKTFTATAVMQLVEQGALRLDDRAAHHIPWLTDEPGSIGRARIRDLLSHAAGVNRDTTDAGFWQLRHDFLSLDELQRRVLDDPPVFEPITQFKYSNIGYSLLGLVIEAASGMPYDRYVTANIIERLSLTDTGPDIDERARALLATGYSSRRYGMDRFPFPHMSTGAMASATGFWSTAADVCRYGAAHFMGDERLVSDESKREMQHQHWKVDGRPGHYGLGFQASKVGDRRLVGHGGGFPGFITYTWIDPRDQLVVTVLTNAIDGPAEALATGVVQLVNRVHERRGRVTTPLPPDAERMVGRYFGLWSVVDIAKLGNELVAVDPEVPLPEDNVTELRPEADGVLRITRAAGYASPGEPVTFTYGDDGSVASMRFAGSELLRWDRFDADVLTPMRVDAATRDLQSQTPSP